MEETVRATRRSVIKTALLVGFVVTGAAANLGMYLGYGNGYQDGLRDGAPQKNTTHVPDGGAR